ncbi:DUF6573 family protein [Caballeronia sp. INML5]|uniref:DUF6573 family protein n=1 Tax=Caballeronia sp. INML5 TaxID=2921750 RepID=UPI0020294898|nr:DUF6573 family protein [Caballeronia sp. INML5]
MEKLDSRLSIFGKVVSVYTRAQAIADSVLIDVTAEANEAGFKVPVAITATAWAEVVAWSGEDSARHTEQSERERLSELMWAAATLARHHSGSRMPFRHHRMPRGGSGGHRIPVTLVMAIGPGDKSEPVITLMLPSDE